MSLAVPLDIFKPSVQKTTDLVQSLKKKKKITSERKKKQLFVESLTCKPFPETTRKDPKWQPV